MTAPGEDTPDMDPNAPHLAPVPTGETGDSSPERHPDTYSTGEAARLLGNRDPSQVRQWIKQGRLDAVSTNPYRITRESVHRMRDELRPARPAGRHAGEAVSATGHPVDVERLVASIVQQVMPRALEAQAAASDKVEGMLREQLDEERHNRRAAEAAAAEARAQAAEHERRAAELAAELDQTRAARRRRWGRSAD